MKKRILGSLSLLVVFAVFVQASVTVQIISNTTTGQFQDSNGDLLADGSLMRVGFFDVNIDWNSYSESQLLDVSFIETLFTGFTSFTSSLGNFQASDLNLTTTNPNQQLYAWVFNSPTPETATEYGIFTAATWLSPNDGGTVNMLPSAIDETVVGSEDGSTPTNYLLTPVPEPAHFAMVFGLLGLGVVLWRRRR